MSWNLPTAAEEWDHYGEADLELASIEQAAGPILDPTDPEVVLHGFPEPLPWWERDDEQTHEMLAELCNAMAMDFPGSTITLGVVKAQLRMEAAEAAGYVPPSRLHELEPFGVEWERDQDERWAA
jgi:hypothetical protein